MIDTVNHVELNGVKYRLAQDAEGDHYSLDGEPLRPPNAVTVQGEQNQIFQMRPDVLQWTLTDWSGGEGQYKVDPTLPNRWWELDSVRVFERPGTLRSGRYLEDTKDSGGSNDLNKRLFLATDGTTMVGLDMDAAAVYTWNDGSFRWGAAAALTGPTAGARAIASDGDYVYWTESAATSVWRAEFGSMTAPTEIVTADIDAGSRIMDELGAYLYVMDTGASATKKIWECPKSGTGGNIEIDNFNLQPLYADMAPVDGHMYVMISDGYRTIVRDITGSSAAGTGFGYETVNIQGFVGRACWSHSGTLFMVGSDQNTQSVMYVTPDGSYGTLGTIREGASEAVTVFGSGAQNSRMLDSFFVSGRRTGESAEYSSLWQVGAISGGFASLAYGDTTDELQEPGGLTGVVVHKNDVFFSTGLLNTGNNRIIAARGSRYATDSAAVSPWHDFALSDEKILSSIVLSVEALPADWTVHVDYGVNGSTSFTNVISYTTDSGEGTKAAVSTDSSSISFRSLRIRIRLEYTGAGAPTDTPVVLGVDVLTQVAQPQRVWRLLLDLSDDHSNRGAASLQGDQKVTNIKTAGATKAIIDFKDGYQSGEPGVYEQVDVYIDAYRVNLSLPGEGYGQVVLREVA